MCENNNCPAEREQVIYSIYKTSLTKHKRAQIQI